MTAGAERETVLRQALIQLGEARARLQAAEQASREPIAIVGVGCRFPGAESPAAFWRLLEAGADAVGEVPPARWDIDEFYDPDPDAPGMTYSRHGAFIADVDRFDASFFGIPPREAALIDPQHRLVLEVAWSALEHAGIAPDSLRGTRAGVYLGMTTGDYAHVAAKVSDRSRIDAYLSTGNAANFASGRLSYLLGLQGPSVALDTACSSSLVAMHLACAGLRSGECDLALAGGVNLMLLPETTIALAKARMLSATGRCRTFDAAADGYVRGEGCGVTVLKRLSDAEADGDQVLALVRGSAVNQDGRSSGVTVPYAAAQEDVIRRALQLAEIEPGAVQFIEAHGTGTPLGDPIELRALGRVLAEGRARPVLIGSVKTNIGHLEAAAGVAGVIKAALALEHGRLPPHLHFTDPNPHIDWDALPVRVVTEPTELPPGRRIAGISSFGISGTNAHVLLESATQAPASAAGGGRPVVIKLSAHGEPALRESARRVREYVIERPTVDLAALADAACTGRADLPDRAAIVATNADEVAMSLDALSTGASRDGLRCSRVPAGTRPKLAFLIPDRAAGCAGPLVLLRSRPSVVRVLDQLAEVLGPLDQLPLAVLLETTADARQAPARSEISEAASYALAIALAAWWRDAGVRPAALLGRGGGAYAAGALAGVFSVPDGARLLRDGGDGIELHSPATSLVSERTGSLLGDEVTEPAYWLPRQSESDGFEAGLATLAELGCGQLVELSAGTSLGPAMRPGVIATDEPAAALAQAWLAGAPIDWRNALERVRPRPRLPGYPFQRERHWIEHSRHRLAPALRQGLEPQPIATPIAQELYSLEVSPESAPIVAEHRVYGHMVVPGVAYLELLLAAAERSGLGPAVVDEFQLHVPLTLAAGDRAEVQIVLDSGSGGGRAAEIHSRTGGHWRHHASATVRTRTLTTAEERPALEAIRARCEEALSGEQFYATVWHPQFELGPSFRLVEAIHRRDGEALALLRVPPAQPGGPRPELLTLDACVQALVATLPEAERPAGETQRPLALGIGHAGFEGHRPMPDDLVWCWARLHEGGEGELTGDIRVFDRAGDPVAAVSGVGFRRIAAETVRRLGGPADRGGRGSARPNATVAVELRGAGEAERSAIVRRYLTAQLANVLGMTPDALEPDAPVASLADSLMLAELKTRVEDDLGVELPFEMLFEHGRLDELAERIASGTVRADGQDRPAAATMSTDEMIAAARLEVAITPRMPHRAGRATDPEAVLLTGATGFLGAFLLDQLLEQTDARVHCLVRASSHDEALERISANLTRYGLSGDQARVIPELGDLTRPRLGLERAAFDGLARRLDGIYHCGAVVNWTYPYSELAAANVGGTREVLRLAVTQRPLPVHFTSTVGVFSAFSGPQLVAEDTMLERSGPLAVGYAQTKWVAEQMVRNAAARGLPVTIHRPSIAGDSRTGAFNAHDHLVLAIKGCLELGFAPQSELPVQIAPVDFVARALVTLSLREDALGATFHLVNPETITWSELFDLLAELGYSLRRLPPEEWIARLRERAGTGETNSLTGLLPFLTGSLRGSSLPVFDCRQTSAALHGSGIECPGLDVELIATYLEGFASGDLIRPLALGGEIP